MKLHTVLIQVCDACLRSPRPPVRGTGLPLRQRAACSAT
jgi:hypothetical protein